MTLRFFQCSYVVFMYGIILWNLQSSRYYNDTWKSAHVLLKWWVRHVTNMITVQLFRETSAQYSCPINLNKKAGVMFFASGVY